MSQSPKLSGDTIAYLKTLAKLESLSSDEQHFDFSSYYQPRLRNVNLSPYLSIPSTTLFPAAVEGVEQSANNNGRMEFEAQEQEQEESMIERKVNSDHAENQELSTKSTDRTASGAQQLQDQLYPDDASCFYDHFNQDQDDRSEMISTSDNSDQRRGYMRDENGPQAPVDYVQHEQDSDNHISELTRQQTTSEEGEQERRTLIDSEERKASRQNYYHNRIRFLTKELAFLLETDQEKFIKLFEEKLRLNNIPKDEKARYLQYCEKERARFNRLFQTQCKIYFFWNEDDEIITELIREYLLRIIAARKTGQTKGRKSKCEPLIATENDLKEYFNPSRTDSAELSEKKIGARLAVEIFFKNKFYEHWISEVYRRLKLSNSIYTEPMKRLLTKKKNSIYHLFVPYKNIDILGNWE